VDEKPISRWWRWAALRRDIAGRFSDPLEHPTFFFFFLFFVFGLGSAGTWVELFKLKPSSDPTYSLEGLITSLVTFASVLIGTSCTQISIDEGESKAFKTLALGVLVAYVFIVVLAAVGIGKGITAAWLWTLASALALAVWWIANANAPGYRDPDAPTGGSLKKELQGSLSGYTTE
jgi:hypothetical protein